MDLRTSSTRRGALTGLRACLPVLCALLLAGDLRPAAAQEDPGDSSGGFSLWGRVPGQTRAIGGIWSLHPYAISFPRIEETYGYGVQWRGWFAATFVNSYGDRSVTAGVERVWAELDRGPFAVGLGYRAGLITGYDERLLSWADDVPVLPLLGLQGWVGAGPLRFDAFYVYRVVTLEGSIRLSW